MGQLPTPAFSLGRQGMVQLAAGGPGERHEGQWRQRRGWGCRECQGEAGRGWQEKEYMGRGVAGSTEPPNPRSWPSCLPSFSSSEQLISDGTPCAS